MYNKYKTIIYYIYLKDQLKFLLNLLNISCLKLKL